MKNAIWQTLIWIGCSLPAWAGSVSGPQAVAQSVLDRLYATNGNYRFKKPILLISPENKKVAAYSPSKNTISLDEKAYTICRGFGRDSLAALAYILGHELVHACQSQIKGQQQTNFLAYDKALKADTRTEKVADIQGVFNAWLAGYGVLGAMPGVIGEVYRAYGLEGRTLGGYPTLPERQATCRDVVSIVENLCAVFESCGYLLAIDQVGLACTGYEYILQYYQGREIYNNLGVAYTLGARQFWNPKTDNYIYPVEADWYTKLQRINAARGAEEMDPTLEPLRQAFLEKALANFKAAARLDPAYLPARVNTVCALDMAGRPVEALKYAELNLLPYTNGKKKRKGPEAELADIALGITYALQPGGRRKAEAEAIFQRLAGSSSALGAQYAHQNLQTLHNETEAPGALPELPLPKPLRSILDQLQPGRTGDLPRTLLDEPAGIGFARRQNAGSTAIVFSNNQGNLVSLLRAPYAPTADVLLLPSRAELQATAYRNLIVSAGGFYLKVARDKAVLKVDAEGRVLEVVKYIEHGQ